MLRGLTDFRVVKITTLKLSKSLIISVLWVAPLGGLTCSHHSNQVFPLWSRVIPLWNRVTSPLKVLLPQNPGGLLPLCPFYHTSEGPPATESELPYKNPSCSTSEVVCSYFCNRVVSPLRVLLPLYPCNPTSEGASATEFWPFYHRIRTVTQEPESFYIRNPNCHTGTRAIPHQKSSYPTT